MIRLVTTNDKLQLVLAGAVATNQLQCVVNYSDNTGTDYVGSAKRTNSNNTTDVDICLAPAASQVRDIDAISIYNKDTAAATVTVKIDVSGTEYILSVCTLLPGDTLVWQRGTGWQVTDNTGRLKTSDSGGGGGGGLDAHYEHDQVSASTSWSVTHNLGKIPAVTIIDSGGNMLWSDVDHIDVNSLVINFANATSGKAYCN